MPRSSCASASTPQSRNSFAFSTLPALAASCRVLMSTCGPTASLPILALIFSIHSGSSQYLAIACCPFALMSAHMSCSSGSSLSMLSFAWYAGLWCIFCACIRRRRLAGSIDRACSMVDLA